MQLYGLDLKVKSMTVSSLITKLLNVVEQSTYKELQKKTVLIPVSPIPVSKTILQVPMVVPLIGIEVLTTV